jgi:hypothetical protein
MFLNRDEGLPPLADRAYSKSASSIPKDHQAAVATPGVFNAVTDLQLARVPSSLKAFVGKLKAVPFATEADVELLTSLLLNDIIHSLGDTCHQMQLHHQLSVTELRPDIMAVKFEGRPVGMIEIKVPSRNNNVMDDARVHGSMFDYLTMLREVGGAHRGLCVLATYDSFRVGWLEESNAMASASTVREVEYDADRARRADAAAPASDVRSTRHVESTVAGLVQQLATSTRSTSGKRKQGGRPQARVVEKVEFPRRIHLSPVIRGDDRNIVPWLGSILLKMSRNVHRASCGPLDGSRAHIILTREAWHWARVDWRGVQLHHSRLPAANELILLSDMGMYHDQRCWYVCSMAGLACEMRFPLHWKGRGVVTVAEEEFAAEQKLQTDKSAVRLSKLCNRDVILKKIAHEPRTDDEKASLL